MWYFAWYLRNLSFSSFERDFKLQREGGAASWKQHLQAPNSHPDTALKSRDQSKTLIFNIPQILVNFLCLHEVLYTCHICLLVLRSTLHLSLLWSEHEELKPQVTFSTGSSQWEAMAGEEDASVSLSLSLCFGQCVQRWLCLHAPYFFWAVPTVFPPLHRWALPGSQILITTLPPSLSSHPKQWEQFPKLLIPPLVSVDSKTFVTRSLY